ncbi:MAG: hypothetical protein AB7U75_12855 [Hyphomicrobiaceae bacterium]
MKPWVERLGVGYLGEELRDVFVAALAFDHDADHLPGSTWARVAEIQL